MIIIALAALPLVVSDECADFQSLFSEVETKIVDDLRASPVDEFTGEVTTHAFCNDEGFCEGLFVDSDGLLTDESSMGSIPASCVYAYERAHPLGMVDPSGEDPTAHFPSTVILGPGQVGKARSDDSSWTSASIANRKLLLFSRSTRERKEQEAWQTLVYAWNERSYPDSLTEELSDLEQMIETIVSELSSTFPLVSASDLHSSWLPNFVAKVDSLSDRFRRHARKDRILSIFRNLNPMRAFSWYMSAIIGYSSKETNETRLSAFLSGASPFVFAFTYMENKLGTIYPDMYQWAQSFLVTISDLESPLPGVPWHLTMHDVADWVHPELKLVPSRFVDWNTVFSHAEIATTQVENFNAYMTGMLDAMLDLAFTTKLPDIMTSQLKKAGLVFVYLASHEVDISELCSKHEEGLNRLIRDFPDVHPSYSYQVVMAVIDSCTKSGFLSLSNRLGGVLESWVPEGLNHHTWHIWLQTSLMPSDLVSRVSHGDAHALAGTLFFSFQDPSLKVYRAEPSWMSDAIDGIFTEYFTEHIDEEGCRSYSPKKRNNRTTLRAIGRIFAIYIRERHEDMVLTKYMRACSDSDTVRSVLFKNSEYIRRGFYDVFVEGDFERLLIDGSEVEDMLKICADPDSDLNPKQAGRVVTL